MHRARPARASGAPGKTQHAADREASKENGRLDAGPRATSLGHLAPGAKLCQPRREGARPAVATCRTPAAPAAAASPAARTAWASLAHRRLRSAPLGCHESRPAEGEADRLLTRSAAHLTTAQRPERTRSHPSSLRLRRAQGAGRVQTAAGADPRAAPADAVQPPQASAGKDRTLQSSACRLPGHGAPPGTPHLCARGRSGALLPRTPTAPAGTA